MSSDTARVPPHFIVVVPGYLGSKLRDRTTGKTVWVDFGSMPKNPLHWGDWVKELADSIAYPNDNLEPAGILDDVLFVLPWAKLEEYGRLLRSLEGMGYRVDPNRYAENELNVYSFTYDWRQDNRISGKQLAQAVERWSAYHPDAKVWIIAHSNGGLVSRWYIEKEGGKDYVSRLFLMATPWDGTPKAQYLLFNGLDVLFRRRLGMFDVAGTTRRVLRTFPSIYQLLPHKDSFLRDSNDAAIDPFSGNDWLDDAAQLALLEDARRFNDELGTNLSVETLCFFGRSKRTTTNGIVSKDAAGHWQTILWSDAELGDGTLPEKSAYFPNASERLPFDAGHGDIYAAPAVLTFLKWELVDKYTSGTLGTVETAHLTVTFDPDKDIYSPSENINLLATVRTAGANSVSLSGAAIHAELIWQSPLPGSDVAEPPTALPSINLSQAISQPGIYTATLPAPSVEGYYQVRATINVQGEPTLTIDELIAIEASD